MAVDVQHLAVVVAANYLITASVLAFAINWRSPQWLRALAAALLGVVLAVGLAAALGVIVHEQRPFVAEHFTPLISHNADSSFPSDHLSALGAVTAAAWLSQRSAGIFAALLSTLVGAARVAAGVHYPIDVIAGFLLGLACATVFWQLLGVVSKPLATVDAWLSLRHFRPKLKASN